MRKLNCKELSRKLDYLSLIKFYKRDIANKLTNLTFYNDQQNTYSTFLFVVLYLLIKFLVS